MKCSQCGSENIHEDIDASDYDSIDHPDVIWVYVCLDCRYSWRDRRMSGSVCERKEGEFGKRMVAFRLKYGLDAVIPEFIHQMLDDARKAYPFGLDPSDCSGLDISTVIARAMKKDKWFLAWMGKSLSLATMTNVNMVKMRIKNMANVDE